MTLVEEAALLKFYQSKMQVGAARCFALVCVTSCLRTLLLALHCHKPSSVSKVAELPQSARDVLHSFSGVHGTAEALLCGTHGVLHASLLRLLVLHHIHHPATCFLF